MNRFLLLLVALGVATPAHADLVHQISSSVQLSVDAAAAQTDNTTGLQLLSQWVWREYN